MAQCHACKLEIVDGASKCVHCDSYQNFRRFFSFGTSATSLLIALISVAALFISNLDALVTVKGKIDGSVSRVGKDYLVFVASNSGETPAAIVDAVITAPAGDGSYIVVKFAPGFNGEEYVGLLQPEGFKGVTLKEIDVTVRTEKSMSLGSLYSIDHWILTVNFIDYEGDLSSQTTRLEISPESAFFKFFAHRAEEFGLELAGI